MLLIKTFQIKLWKYTSKFVLLYNHSIIYQEFFFSEFLAPVAHCPINIDSRIMAITKTKMETPDRYTYDEARVWKMFMI